MTDVVLGIYVSTEIKLGSQLQRSTALQQKD